MSGDLTALGPDGIRRSYDEHYDTMMDVEQDPTGAWQAIQKQADRIEELEAENKKLRLEVYHANDVADVSIDKAKELEATLRKLEYWFDTDQEILDVMGNNEKADHMRKLKMIRDALGGDSDD